MGSGGLAVDAMAIGCLGAERRGLWTAVVNEFSLSHFRVIQYDCVCVYYCRTYYKAVRGGGGGEWRTCVCVFIPKWGPQGRAQDRPSAWD